MISESIGFYDIIRFTVGKPSSAGESKNAKRNLGEIERDVRR